MKRKRRNRKGEVMSLRCRKEYRGGLRKNLKKVSERERKMKINNGKKGKQKWRGWEKNLKELGGKESKPEQMRGGERAE